MTDDTGQPTVDRLGALEAALREAVRIGTEATEFAHGWIAGLPVTPSFEDKRAAQAALELARDQLRAALDTASPLTTPTPDQGALERARRLANRLAKHFIGEQFAAEDETCSRCVAMVTDALAAAEAKARAAERERCEQIVQNYIDRPTSGPKNNTLSAFEQGMDHMAGCIDNASAILDAIRVVATPAQSET